MSNTLLRLLYPEVAHLTCFKFMLHHFDSEYCKRVAVYLEGIPLNHELYWLMSLSDAELADKIMNGYLNITTVAHNRPSFAFVSEAEFMRLAENEILRRSGLLHPPDMSIHLENDDIREHRFHFTTKSWLAKEIADLLETGVTADFLCRGRLRVHMFVCDAKSIDKNGTCCPMPNHLLL